MAALVEAQTSGIWFDRSKVEEAEYKYQEYLVRGKTVKAGAATVKVESSGGIIAQKIAEARQHIKDSLKDSSTVSDNGVDGLTKQVESLSKENKQLKSLVTQLTDRLQKLEVRLSAVENKSGGAAPTIESTSEKSPAATGDEDEDSDIDLFGSDSEDEEEKERVKAERVAAYNERKKNKKVVIAKSTIVLDVKPWDDETDMAELEKCVRSVECDGLKWGASKLAKIAYGIMKLQINCVVEDDKVGTDFLEEHITAFDDYVQSVDIAAFNKI